MKKVFILALCLLFAGALLFVGGLAMAGGDMSEVNIETDLVKINMPFTAGSELGDSAFAAEYTYPAEGVERIIIDVLNADVRIGYAERGGQIHVLTDSGEVEFDPPKNGTLRIEQKSGKHHLFSIDFDGTKNVTVLLPPGYNGLGPDMTVNTVSGDVDIDVTELGDVDIGTTSGDISAVTLDCEVWSSMTVSGDTWLDGVNASRFGAYTTSGDIDFGFVSATREVEISTISGDVTGTLAGSREIYDADVSTVSGDSSVRDGGEGEVRLSLSSVSGDMDIDFALS